MRGYVTDRHLAALKAAVTICRLEDLGNSAEANIRKEQFDRHFKNDGKQIYNMIRSRIFHEWILPVFLERKYIEQNLKRSQEIFQEFFAMCVQYLPWAIFVGKHKDEYDLRQAIMSRALDERVKMVAVFTRGPRLALMAERACEDVRKSLTAAGLTASIEAKDYKIGDSPARVYLLEFSR